MAIKVCASLSFTPSHSLIYNRIFYLKANAAIASRFQISSFPAPSKNTPKLNETQPLTLFYHTHTEYLKTLLVMLKKVNKRKFLKTLEKLRMLILSNRIYHFFLLALNL